MGEDQIVVTVDAALADLVPIFLANCRAHARTLRAAADAGDLDAARSVGHNLNGSGSSYGFDRVSEFGREIERTAGAEDTRALSDLAQQLEDYLARVRPVSG